MFSGPVTTMTSIPAAARRSRARATRWSYSTFGNADSEPCRMPPLSISEVSDEVSGRGVESDTEAGWVAGVHGACRVRDARNGIVDDTVGAIELRKGRRRRTGHMKRRGSRGRAFVHLADHEGNARNGQSPRCSDRRRYTTQLHQFEVRKNATAIAANPCDIVRRSDAFVEHDWQRTSIGKAVDGGPVSGRNGLFDVSEIVDGQRVELLERFRRRPTPVCISRNLDLGAEARPQRRDPTQILGKVGDGYPHLEVPEAAVDIGLRLRQKLLERRPEQRLIGLPDHLRPGSAEPGRNGQAFAT